MIFTSEFFAFFSPEISVNTFISRKQKKEKKKRKGEGIDESSKLFLFQFLQQL